MNQHHLTVEPTQHLFQRKKYPVRSLWAEMAVSQFFGTGVGKQGETGPPMRQGSTDLRTVPYRCSLTLNLSACLLSAYPSPDPLKGMGWLTSLYQGSIIHHFMVGWEAIWHRVAAIGPLPLPWSDISSPLCQASCLGRALSENGNRLASD